MSNPRILFTAPKTSSYSDGSSWAGITSELFGDGKGIWLKPGERLAVLPPLTPEEIAQSTAAFIAKCESSDQATKTVVRAMPAIAKPPKPPKAEPGDSIWVQPSVIKTKNGEVKLAGLTLREHMSGPVFTAGQKVICLHASGYPYLVEGDIYEVIVYDPSEYTPTFTWPAYVTVHADYNGRTERQRGHASRFRAILEASDVGLP